MNEDDRAPEPGVAVVGGSTPAADQGRPRLSLGDRASRLAGRGGSSGSGGGGGARTVQSRRKGQPEWLVPVLLIVSALSIVLAIVFAIAWSGERSQRSTQDTVTRVGRDFLNALTNFTPSTIDADFRRISTYATGDFARQSNQFFGSSIRQQLEQAQASSQGQIRYIYIQSLGDNQASLYAEVDQTYVNRQLTTPRTDVLQVVLNLTDTSSGWKISAVTVLQPPSSSSAPTGNASSATGG